MWIPDKDCSSCEVGALAKPWLKPFTVLYHLRTAVPLSEKYCFWFYFLFFFFFSHFTCEEIKTWMLSNLPKVTLEIRVTASISAPSVRCQTSHEHGRGVCFPMAQTASQSHGTFTVSVWQIWDEYLMNKCTSIQHKHVVHQLGFQPAVCKDPSQHGGEERKPLNLVPT